MDRSHSILLGILVTSAMIISCSNAMANDPSPHSRVTLAAAPVKLDTALIERLTGHKGTLSAKEGAFKVSVPRSDLRVTTAGGRMTPPMGLTSWAAFQPAGSQTMLMGDWNNLYSV